VNGGAPAGVSAAWSNGIFVLHNGLIVMQTQMRKMLAVASRLARDKTGATAAEARPSSAGEALRENRLAWNARGGLADGEVLRAPWRPLALMLADVALAWQSRAELGSGGAAPEHEALSELGLFWTAGKP
jgi:predicted phage gp36 major capsid-like protein